MEQKSIPMRKLIYAINLSLDGCCDHTKLSGDEEIHEYFTNLMQETDLFVYGRKTYELMVPFWPDVERNQSAPTKAMNDFAITFNAIPKLVFSRSLNNAEDGNTRVVHSNIKDEMLKLKQEPGKNIATGGVDIPSQLIELGLVDEFIFVIQPFVVGEGRRLLDSTQLPENLQLELVESKWFRSGGVALRYSR